MVAKIQKRFPSPIWSYYADNHRGVCIEFPFEKRKPANPFQ
ncbi:MAG: DUF2971 domain-containing protein [Undibacterium sp.]|nr:DUF2971 domain-containing protein [Opitutaceae bacterium]